MAGNITIVRRKAKVQRTGRRTIRVNVGRPTPLGNPFIITKHNTREVVINSYKDWFEEQVEDKNPHVLRQLQELKEILMRGYDLELECYCAPLDCHARIIKEYLES